MGIWEISAWQLLVKSGPIVIPIVICSFLAVAIAIEKFMYFAKIKTDVPNLKESVFRCVQQNNIKQALAICEADPSPVAKILKAGILKYGETRDDIKEAMEDVSLFEIPKLEARLSALATISNVTPLLGLLGTVTGMTGSFHTIQVRSASMNPVTPGDLAGGIWEALLSTVAGLMVAIPSFVLYNYFVSRVNQIVVEMERAATELVNLLSHVSEGTSTHREG